MLAGAPDLPDALWARHEATGGRKQRVLVGNNGNLIDLTGNLTYLSLNRPQKPHQPPKMYPSYVPAADSDFAVWLANFDTLLTAAPADFGLVAGDAVIVAAVALTFATDYPVSQAPGTRTPVTVAAKDVARAAAEATVRPYAVQISLNGAVLDANKIAIGVTVPSLVPTPVPAPINAPELGIGSITPGIIEMTYKETGAAGKAKPFGVTGVEVQAAIGAVHVATPAEASFLTIVTKSPARLVMDPADAGKAISIFTRFLTRSGPGGQAQFGPWSLALDTVVA